MRHPWSALWAVALTALACPVASAQQPSFTAPEARVFTLAGGGASHTAREGQLGTDIRLGEELDNVPLTALPDGAIAATDNHHDPILITLAGRIHRLPMLDAKSRIDVRYLAAASDGSLFADGQDRTSGDFKGIYRLTAGAARWQRVLRPTPQGPHRFVRGLAALGDGAFVLAADDRLWHVSGDGTVQRVFVEPAMLAEDVGTLASFPDGTIAMTSGQRDLLVLSPDGTLRAIAEAGAGFDATLRLIPDKESLSFGDLVIGLAAMPDGGILRAAGAIDEFPAGGGSVILAGAAPSLGLGDGGSPAHALTSARSVALPGDGALAFSDLSSLGAVNAPFNVDAVLAKDGTLFTAGWNGTPLIRVIVGPDTQRPLAAIAPTTFATLQTGSATVTSTFPGIATLVVRNSSGRLVAKVSGPVAAGDSELRLPRRPPATDLRLSLTVRGANGNVAKARAALNTRSTLSWRRARRLIRTLEIDEFGDYEGDFGVYAKLGRCRRVDATRVDCQEISVSWSAGSRDKVSCYDVQSAISRPDGVRVVRTGGSQACRAIRSR